MFRVVGLVSLLALCAGAAHAEEDRAAYKRTQVKLTEQLNAQIAKGVTLEAPAPPAKADPFAPEPKVAKSDASAPR